MLRSLSLAAASLALLTAGCGGANDPIVSDAERRVGAEQHPQLLAEFGGSYAGDEAVYLRRTGEKLAAAAGLGGQCTFTLVNSDVVNAFAVPGCYIYVTRGLMSIFNSEAELASVLAHEVGHISGNHSDRQQKRSILRALGVMAVSLLTGSERISQIAGAAAGFFTLRYSRKHEYEADDLGLGYLRQAGYDPHAAPDMLSALGRHDQFLTRTRGHDEARSIPEWALTHPLTDNRVRRARDAATAIVASPDALPEFEARFLQQVDGLLYGDDPEQGFVDGRRFAHPLMRFAFEAPPGFTLTNSPQAILIEGPDGLRGEFGGGQMPAGGLPAYAEAALGQILKGATVEFGAAQQLSVNGVPALVVPASVATDRGTVQLSFAAYEAGGGAAHHFLMISPAGAAPPAALDALFRSYRRISAEEAATLRPRRIEVVRAGTSDSWQSLARRMATEHGVEHLLMLNGRAASEQVRPGELLKVVAFAGR